MELDTWIALVACGVVVAVAIGAAAAAIARSRSAARTDREVDRFAERVGLVVSEGMRGPLRARIAELGRSGAVTSAAVALVVVAATVAATSLPGAARMWLATGIVALGLPAVQLLSARRALQRVPEGSPRVARARAVSLTDYLDPVLVVAYRIAAPLAFAAAVTTALLGTDRSLALDAAQLAGVAALPSAIAFELSARALVRSPQPAGDSGALAWDDAFRSSALVRSVFLPTWVSAYTLMTIGSAWIGSATIGPLRAVLATGSLIAIVAVVAVGLAVLIRTPFQRYLRRLWPELASRAGSTATAGALAPGAPAVGAASADADPAAPGSVG